MIKRISATLICICILFSLMSIPIIAESGSSYKTRDDFTWGITLHNYAYEAYSQDPEVYIKASAELGVELIRINVGIYNDDFSYLDSIVALCSRYRLKIILLLPLEDDLEKNTEIYKKVCSRYNGKSGYGFIDYIEIGGEEEVPLLLNKYPVNGPDGSSIDHYYESDIINLQAKYQSAIDGVMQADSEVKTLIDFSHLHYAPLLYMYQNGLDFDVVGIDWYTNMGDISNVLTSVINNFPHDIIITETNLWSSEGTDHEDALEWNGLLDFMSTAYSKQRVKGLCFYELMDEPAFESDGNFNTEAHFGFLYTNSDGSIKGVKPIYTKIKQLLSGAEAVAEPALPEDAGAVLDLDGSHKTFADTPNWLFSYVSDWHNKENAGLADFSNFENISFDIKIGDFEAFRSIIAQQGINLWFRLTSSESRNNNTASAELFLDEFKPLGNNWYRVQIPKSEFVRQENGGIDWSAVKSWMFFIEGNSSGSIGSIYSMEFCFRNICAAKRLPEPAENAEVLLDKSGKSNSIGDYFHYLCDRVNNFCEAVDFSDAKYIEFDISISSALLEALGDKKLYLHLTSSGGLWSARSGVCVNDYLSENQGGWYHCAVPKSYFSAMDGEPTDWSAVNTWFLTFEGNDITQSTGALSSSVIDVKNICATSRRLAVPQNAVAVLDAAGGSASIGECFHYLCDRFNRVLSVSADMHKADFIEFDIKISDKAAIDAVSDKKLHLNLTSSGKLWNNRYIAALGDYGTDIGNGWYHYKIPKSRFVYTGNGYINWYAVDTWFFSFEGSNITESTGDMKDITIDVRNICATVYKLKSDFYSLNNGYLLLDETVVPDTLASGFWGNVLVETSGETVCSGDRIKLLADSEICDSVIVAIKYDIAPNGCADASDLTLLKKFLLGIIEADQTQKFALTGDLNAEPDIKSLVQMKKAIT